MSLRHIILASLLSLSMHPSVTPVYGPELPTTEEAASFAQQMASEAHWLEREQELWNKVVDRFAQELHLEENRAMAERIAEAVDIASQRFDVDPWLMLSLIRVESAGKPEAVSHKGARGLTQIMPATGKHIAEELSVTWKGADMLHDVEVNVLFGTFYVRYLLDRFNGDVPTALAAYNWGPKHIEGRIKRGKALPVVYPGKIMSRLSSIHVQEAS